MKSPDIGGRGHFKIIEFHHKLDAGTDAKDWKWLSSGGVYNDRGKSTLDSWRLAIILQPRTPPFMQSVSLPYTCTTHLGILFWENQVQLVFQSSYVPGTTQRQENRHDGSHLLQQTHAWKGTGGKEPPIHSSDFSTNFTSSEKASLVSSRSSLLPKSPSYHLAKSATITHMYMLWNYTYILFVEYLVHGHLVTT